MTTRSRVKCSHGHPVAMTILGQNLACPEGCYYTRHAQIVPLMPAGRKLVIDASGNAWHTD